MLHQQRGIKLLICSILGGMLSGPAIASTKQKVSSFGRYEGYSTAKYKTWVVTSRYVKMRDGVKLAVDVVRPRSDGKPVATPLPVIWTHSRYHRNPRSKAPQLKSFVDARPDLQRLVRHGYVVVTVSVRGSGASFGRFEGLFSPNETKDAFEIIGWIAKQPWCNGKVGMFGGSYLGMTQYMAASQAPPALKAIFPDVAGFDMYDIVYPGGIYRQDLLNHWGRLTRILDTTPKVPHVQGDKDGRLLKMALAEHKNNWDVIKGYRAAKFRDTRSPGHSYATHNPAAFLPAINRAKVPAYHWNGFFDVFVKDATLWYANYAGPQRLGIGPWSHSVVAGRPYLAERFKLMTVEQHRWFDYWLKGIDNGIMREAPINYAVLIEPKKWTWRTAKQWPPAGGMKTTFYFANGPSGSVKSINDGLLVRERPKKNSGADTYQVDPTTTTGTSTRWDSAVGAGPMQYGDMTKNDRKCLTYTSPPLKKDVAVVGHPVANLFIDCSAEDCDFIVVLEEVDQKGRSHYVTEGLLRASHRKLTKATWNNLGLPFHRSFKKDRTALPKAVVTQLKFDLYPTATVFNAGHRIRITVMCADKDNLEPPISKNANVRVHRSLDHPSHVVLPIYSFKNNKGKDTTNPVGLNDVKQAVNKYCPRSGKPIARSSLTRYRGFVVGFCNPHCRDDFANNIENRPRDRRYFDNLIEARNLKRSKQSKRLP